MYRNRYRLLLSALLAALVCQAVPSFAAPLPRQASNVPGAELRISLVTIGPGADVWERFGHNAIAVEDTVRGTSRWYNYGMFSFGQEGFKARFIQGRMMYWMEGQIPRLALRQYMTLGRSVLVQDLNLTPAQRIELRDFLEQNELPENAYYLYDYYYDNCSTRVRDALDHVLGGVIKRSTEASQTDRTFRFHTQRLTAANPLIYTGVLILLGPAVDGPMDAWQELFLPLMMPEYLREITVTGEDGDSEPLVLAERTLYESDMWAVDARPPRWALIYLVIGAVLAGAMVWSSSKGARSRAARMGFVTMATLWMTVVGVLGTVLLVLWVATDHSAAYRNENLFLFNPFSLALALALLLVVARVEWAKPVAKTLCMVVVGLSLLGFVAQILPGLDQVNGQLYALMLLPNMAAAAGVRLLIRSRAA